jgi:hypothetical protein
LAPHELTADDLASEKPGRLVIEHFGDFLSNTTKRLRVVFDFLRLDHLLLDRQLLWPALSALLLLCALRPQAFVTVLPARLKNRGRCWKADI